MNAVIFEAIRDYGQRSGLLMYVTIKDNKKCKLAVFAEYGKLCDSYINNGIRQNRLLIGKLGIAICILALQRGIKLQAVDTRYVHDDDRLGEDILFQIAGYLIMERLDEALTALYEFSAREGYTLETCLILAIQTLPTYQKSNKQFFEDGNS